MVDTRQDCADRDLDRAERQAPDRKSWAVSRPGGAAKHAQLTSTMLAYALIVTRHVHRAPVFGLAHLGPVHPCSRSGRAAFHHSARLRPWFLLPFAARKRDRGLALQHRDAHALCQLAAPACRPPCGVEQSRPAPWRGRHLFGCLTLQEYLDLPARRRLFYRIGRHPAVAQFILPPLVFLVLFRFPYDAPRTWRKERRGVYFTNLALVAMFSGLVVLLGWKQVLLVQLPIMVFASIAGVWLFSVQHRFEDSEWFRQEQWTAAQSVSKRQLVSAASACSSMVQRQYRLPPRASPYAARAELSPGGVPRGVARPRWHRSDAHARPRITRAKLRALG